MSKIVTGIVEDSNDPLGQGRVRVRVFELHNPDTTLLPTEDLPWAQCVYPVTVSGTGQDFGSLTSLLPGAWVVGYYRDGADAQDLVVLGSLAGGYNASAQGIGSSDINDYSPTYGASNVDPSGPAGQYDGPPDGEVASKDGVPRTSQGATVITKAFENVGPVPPSAVHQVWDAIGQPEGNGTPWSGAFVKAAVKDSGVIPEEALWASPDAKGLEEWANASRYANVIHNPTAGDIHMGDIVVMNNKVQMAFATDPPNANGVINTLQGDVTYSGPDKSKQGANGVFEVPRRLDNVAYVVKILKP